MARIIAPLAVLIIIYLFIGYYAADRALPIIRRNYPTRKVESMFYLTIFAWPLVLLMLKVKNKVKNEGNSEWKNYK